MGARQVGKTTLALSLADNYLTFDDANVEGTAKNSPADFIGNLSKPIILDEIQRCPEILSAIKMAVDKNRAAGQFILTGSANVLTTLPKVSESPAGSMEVGRLRPLSRGEILGVKETFVERLCAEEFALPANFPIEVKSSLTVNRHDFKGLHLLADSVPKKFRRGIVLYTGNQFLAFGENLFAVPIQALWK